MTIVSPADIDAAYRRIAPHVRRTPLLEAEAGVSLKLEFLQHAGSFKPRGAFNNLLTREAPPVGCATASGGNHGAAVAYAAGKLGVRAKVFVPAIATRTKIEKIRGYGAEVHVEGSDYFAAQALCDAYVDESGALKIHPYESLETIAGQGTVALEWEEDLSRFGSAPLDTVLVAVGGGGLVAGLASWFAGRVHVIGVEPEGSRAMHAAFAAGAPVEVAIRSVAADSLGSRTVGDLCFSICREHVERVALVNDGDIENAQRHLWKHFQIVTEPGGAAAYAALLSRAYVPAPYERVGVLVCGANADLAAFAQKL